MKCELCAKKIRISSYPCKCTKFFCSEHLPHDKHDCEYDYKTENKKQIEEKNPVIAPVKV